MKRLRVLYLHFTGQFGGASRSLAECVQSFPEAAVEPLFLTQRGNVSAVFARLGEVIDTHGLTRFDHTRYSHYRGARWLVVLRELAFLPLTLRALRQAQKRWGTVDLIHLNEFSGLFALRLARLWFAAPAITHVRSVLEDDISLRRTRLLHRMLTNDVQGVIAIDENVRASLPPGLAVEVIHNGFTPTAPLAVEQRFADRLGGLRQESFKVGFVGNLLRVKGIRELIEAARLTRERGLDVEFIIVGADASPSGGVKAWLLRRLGLQQDMCLEVEAALDRHGLRDRVHLVGFTRDIAPVYRHMDVLAFPSHYDAPGRPIFEAAFSGVPSIVAVRTPRADTLIDGETGIAIKPHRADQLADAIESLANDRPRARRMGAAALAMATRNFDATANARRVLALYRRVVGQAGSQ
ncbi:MAG: glycosyltransferase family 4 protein [Betaproteobacteria bacterium]